MFVVSYPGFEICDLFVRQSISFGDDWDQVHFGVKLAHEFDINWLEAEETTDISHCAAVRTRTNLRVACGLDKVKAGMDAVINNLLPVDTVFLFEIRVEPRFDTFHYGLPALTKRVSEVPACNL